MSSLAILLLLCLGGDLEGARKALAENQPRKALELLGDIAEREDAPTDAYIVQGRAYLALRDYQAAVEPLLRASDARPKDKQLARDGAIACWGSASGAYASAYLADARRLARRAEDDLLLADLFYAGGDFEQALGVYRKLKPTAAQKLHVFQRIGMCLRGLGKREEARAAYGKALDEALAARNLPAAYQAAFAAGQGGRFLAWLDAEVKKTPKDTTLLLYRGYARSASLMYPEAAADLRQVIAARPGFVDAESHLCWVLLSEGARAQRDDFTREGEAIGRKILKKHPRHEDTWQRLAWLTGNYWVNRKIERYYDLLKFMNGLDPERRAVGLNFGGAARRLGHYEEARRAYEALLAVSPEDPDVLNDLAILEDGEGRRDKAIALWERVLAEEEDNLNALENLYTVAWERGDAARLAELLERGLQAARDRGDADLVVRWQWFADRRRWAPSGFGGAR